MHLQYLRSQMGDKDGRVADTLPESEMFKPDQMEQTEIQVEIEYVYGLKQGKDGLIFYVGRTKHPQLRRKQHLTRSPFLAEWLSTFNDPCELVLEILETVVGPSGDREKFHIEKHATLNPGLLNIKHKPWKMPEGETPNAKIVYIDAWACTCERCGRQWNTITDQLPKVCVKCKSLVWNKPPKPPTPTTDPSRLNGE